MINLIRKSKTSNSNKEEKYKKSKELEEVSEYIEKLNELTKNIQEKESIISSVQEDYKKIFNLFSDAVVILDDEMNIIDLNKKAQILFSKFCQKKDFVAIGKNWKDTVIDFLDKDFDGTIENEVINGPGDEEVSKELYLSHINRYYLVSMIPVKKKNYNSYYIFVARDITGIKMRELDLIRKQKLINNIDSITDVLSKNFNINYTMEKIVEILGQIENVDMCYIYKNCVHDDGNLYAEKMKDWRSPLFFKTTNSLDVFSWKYFPRWLEYFKLNHIVCGDVDSFPKNERILLKKEKVKSICVVPIYTPMGLWGFVGFDSCNQKRYWTFDEERLLKIAANIIGSGINQWELRNDHESITKRCINF